MTVGPYLNDTWTLDVTGLGYQHLLHELVELVVTCEPPFAVAAYGGWGSGKTSLLRGAMNHLGGSLIGLAPYEALLDDTDEVGPETRATWQQTVDSVDEERSKKIKTVWFNPWQHQFESHPMIALLHEIRGQFGFLLKTRMAGEKTGYLALKTGLRLLDDLTGSAIKLLTGHKTQIGLDKLEKAGLAYEREHFQTPLDSQRFQMHFETAVAHLVSEVDSASSDGRLVIFIDDLDRCESAEVLHLLEAVKLYMSTRKCVFVFGLDPEHTERCLKKAGLDRPNQARHYLHKLFQMTFHLPRARTYAGFIEKQLKFLNRDEAFSKAAIGGTGEGSLARLLAEILEGNPRRVKNFLNLLFFRGRALKRRDKTEANAKQLALFCALRYYYPVIYRFLEEDPDQLFTIQNGLKLTRQEEAGSGLERFVAWDAHLPHFENPVASEDSEPAFAALQEAHPTDSSALFSVLQRFKKSFREMEIKPDELKRYLIP